MIQLWKLRLLSIIIIAGSLQCWGDSGAASGTDTPAAKTWQVFGRVSTMHGDPLSGVIVQLDIGPVADGLRIMETNLQGEFYIEVRLDPAEFTHLRGTLVAEKSGYIQGRETLDLGLNENNSGVEIVLRELDENADQLSLTALVEDIAPQLKNEAAAALDAESSVGELLRGCEELIDRRNAAAAVPLLNQSVELMPDCIECRLLLSLALLHTGSWTSANRQLEHAFKANNAGDEKRPEPDLVMGVLEAWRGHVDKAAEFYRNALEADSENILALQELGRAFATQRNWKAAERYLGNALQAGADNELRLLRIRALLELGDVNEAANEMDRYSEGRKIKNLPQKARALHYNVQSRLDLISHGQIKSVIDQSPEELIKALPELQGLELAADQSMLEEILRRTGEGVEAFFKSIPNTASLEQVRQERLDRDGDVRFSLDQEFQYIMLTQPGKPGLGIKEYRSNLEGRDSSMAGLNKGLMLTSGFASVSLIFHPLDRNGADFRYLGRQTLDGRPVHVVAFAQKPRTAKMVTRFTSDGRSALILTHGLAWIDSETFHIIRLYTSLLNPLSNVQLLKLTSEIRFQQVEFDGSPTILWLPRDVEIMVNWRGRLLRNRHHYSDFSLFNVEAKEERKPPPMPAAAPSGL